MTNVIDEKQAVPSIREAEPPNRLRQIALAFPLDWTPERPFRLPDDRPELGTYYISWDPSTATLGEDWSISPRDAQGVIVSSIAAPVYHPIRIAQYGLHLHERWSASGDGDLRAQFLAQARWLRDHQVERMGIGGAYPFSFAWEKYGADPGWISGMAQGEAISLLLRADEVAPGEGFGAAALRAAQPFNHTIGEGGVTWRRNGDVFFEEVAVEPSVHILNGSLFATFGLYDLMRCGGPSWVRTLFEEAVATLQRRLVLYDSGFWSYYSMLATPMGLRHPATLKYHAFHIAQLRVLCAMTGDGYFARVAGDWSSYRSYLHCRAWLVGQELLGLFPRFITKGDTIAGGAHAIL